jgi:hypothetical protein
VDEKSRIFSITTFGAWMTKKTLKTLNNNNGVWRSTWVKYLV